MEIVCNIADVHVSGARQLCVDLSNYTRITLKCVIGNYVQNELMCVI